jgi:hypothetical protein
LHTLYVTGIVSEETNEQIKRMLAPNGICSIGDNFQHMK